MTYVKQHTNASFLVNPDFTGPADTLDGLFSGWDGNKYDKTTWAYQPDPNQPDSVKRDLTLTDPDCVFQLLKKHFARYTDAKVVEITGTNKTSFQQICQPHAATGQTGKAGAFVFSDWFVMAGVVGIVTSLSDTDSSFITAVAVWARTILSCWMGFSHH